MTSIGDWGEIINEAEAERFVGREQDLSIFYGQISLTKPRYLVFYITGQGGVGKTTLLNRYKEIAKNFSFLLADCSEQQPDVLTVLEHFAHQLYEQRFPLKHFDERYKRYLQKVDEIKKDPQAPQSTAHLLSRTMLRTAYIAADLVPGLRKGVEYLPQESLEGRAGEWTTYLAKKLTNKDDLALVRNPLSILISLFFKDLNAIAEKEKVLLCFDNFEVTREYLQELLLTIKDYKPSQNIRLAIAGRDQPGAKWEPLRSVTNTIHLNVFTIQEAEKFLETYNIMDPKRRAEILECSGRLPVLMSWLAAPEAVEPDPSMPTGDIVERFLRWVAEPELRQVALWTAIPRTFNTDILKLQLEKRNQYIDEQFAFDWLRTMPFVQQVADGWQYHDVVRRMMLHYQRQKSPQTYRQMHAELAKFYHKYRQELYLIDREQWTSKQWLNSTLGYAYHFLVTDPNKHWAEVISLFVIAFRKDREFAKRLIELLNLSDVSDELSHEQNNIIQLFLPQLQRIDEGGLQKGFGMFDSLCDMAELSPQAKGYALAYRGECYQLDGKWEKARRDFTEALNYMPESAETMISRSMAYGFVGHYQEALEDFNRALALEPKNAWAIANRGVTHRLLRHYQQALEDFDQTITLIDENNAYAIFANRGLVYRFMGRYEEALKDFDRAIALDKQDAWVFARRGMTYRLMGRYEEALEDWNHAITLDGKDSWYWYRRAQIHMMMDQKKDFESDLKVAIELAQASISSSQEDWRVGFHFGLYNLMIGNLDEAKAHYYLLASICPSLSELLGAIENLKELLTLEPFNNLNLAKHILTHLQTRVAELKV